jgi:hypothetical protein
MPDYRAYLLGPDGHVVSATVLQCADDAEAKKQAEQLVDGHDIELWHLARKVATFEHKPKAPVATRRRSVVHTFEDRITAEKVRLEAQIAALPLGPERDELLRKIEQLETASNMADWLKPPSQSPK